MLKITKSSEPIEVKTITACIYAQPGIGKTSLACTAEKPLTLAFDSGVYRSKFRKDVVEISKWSDVTNITAEDLAPYKTVIVDTVGSALDFLAVDIIKDDAKAGRGGALTLQGFGVLKTKFAAWTNFVRSFGIDIILVAHMDEQKKGDDISERLDIQGGSKGTVYKSADLMGRIYLVNGKRTLNFSPTDTAFGKNPAQFPPLDVPDFNATADFFATVIAQTKAELNRMSEEQVKVAAALAEWKGKIDAATTADEFTALIEPIKAADEAVRDNVKRLLVKTAKEKGCTFDGKAGKFVGAAPAAQPATEEAKPAEAKVEEPKPAEQPQPTDAAAPAAREVGADDDDAANRAAAAPTEAEIAQAEADKPAKKKGRAAA